MKCGLYVKEMLEGEERKGARYLETEITEDPLH